jgi:23S rRNA (cytidine1920-2'-O)/16S rRNA (cytidine1409-2'-O)-methyltransferase
VDVGYGQLRGDLRLDPRVVNMERMNLADLRHALPVGVIIEVMTIDLSYLSLAEAVPQLEPVTFASGAEMVALIKPMYELGLAGPPTDEPERAISHAVRGVERGGPWRVVETTASPVLGSRGAREWFLHARRR